MASKYVVLQFGNVITGEYLNIAVYTFDIDEDKPKVYSKFLENWTRVNAAFNLQGEKNADPILDSLMSNWLSKIETKDALQEAIKNANSPWSSLMFTEERASLLPAETLVEDISKTFLVE